MEYLRFRIPVLSFPDKGYSDQGNNGAMIDEEDCGEGSVILPLLRSFWNVSERFWKKKNT
jgi:UDP:flavonoid glycosyltransferase YjiC (YdhE family)